MKIDDELIKKVEENGFNRQDYTLNDIYEILDYGDMNRKYLGLIGKAIDALTPADLETLINNFNAYELFTKPVFSRSSYLTPEMKSKLLAKCPELLAFTRWDNIETYPMAALKAYNKLEKSGALDKFNRPLLDSCPKVKDIVIRNLDKITATEELVDYIIEEEGDGSPLVFLRQPYNKLKGWREQLSPENKRIVDAVEKLNMNSRNYEIEDFFEYVGPLLGKNKRCFNSTVYKVKDNITNEFKEAFQKSSNAPQFIVTDSLETLIAKYNKFMEQFNSGLEPYKEKYKSTSQTV